MLYPLILEDRLELIITTPDSAPLRRTVNVKRAELNRTIAEFRTALQNPHLDAKPAAQKLYNWLIKPLEADLTQAQAQTIIYAPDDQLRYIPLAALHNGQQWLVEKYQINNITAKSLTEFKTQPITQPHILAAAFVTGEYNIPSGQRSLRFRGLPAAGLEIDTLAALIPGTTKLVDKAFSRTATTNQMNDFNIVHLATHGNFSPGSATDSFILFGSGETASLKDVESWTLNHVDLVVLSACETGLGGKFGKGEEILGLGYQFQRGGAKAVISSLWQVDDGGTQALMDACRLGAYRASHRTSETQRRVRTMLAVRDNLVRARVRQVQLLRALLGREGLRPRSGQVSSFARRMDELDIPVWLREIIAPVRTVMAALNQEMVAVEQSIAHIVQDDPVVQRLCTAPGIGPVTAVAFVSTLDQVERFEGAHKVQAYLGLVPSEFSSGERQQRGAITKTGNTRLRWLMVEAAWSILRSRHPRTEDLRAWTQAVAARRGQRIAIVALARKMAGVLFAMWRDETEFGRKGTAPSANGQVRIA